jgi:hypothetical protein
VLDFEKIIENFEKIIENFEKIIENFEKIIENFEKIIGLNLAKILTRVVLDFERGADVVVSVGVHPEREGGSVALRPVVVVGGQDFDHLARRAVLRQDGAVVLQEPGGDLMNQLST